MFSSKFCSNIKVALSVAISCRLVSSTDFFLTGLVFAEEKTLHSNLAKSVFHLENYEKIYSLISF